jgi:hypothetical protein
VGAVTLPGLVVVLVCIGLIGLGAGVGAALAWWALTRRRRNGNGVR